MLEALEDRVRREQLDPGGGELDRERHAVEPGGDPGDGRGVLVRDPEVRPDGDGAGDEQADRLELGDDAASSRRSPAGRLSFSRSMRARTSRGDGQARHRVLLLAADPQRRAARHEDPDSRGAARSRSATTGAPSMTCSKLSRTSRACFGAEPVDEDVAGRPAAALDEPEGRQDRAARQRRVADRLERRRTRCRRGSARRRRPRAGATAGSCRCRPGPVSVSRRVGPEQRGRLGELRLPPDEARQLRRQVVRPPVQRADRREVGSAGPR